MCGERVVQFLPITRPRTDFESCRGAVAGVAKRGQVSGNPEAHCGPLPNPRSHSHVRFTTLENEEPALVSHSY